ncbi:MAG: hypothetical protein HC883_06390 [Bdellovibrionaceae bacterium]|nr:hypothetical protein [Pseudobdellovibrionaceae bacterium]
MQSRQERIRNVKKEQQRIIKINMENTLNIVNQSASQTKIEKTARSNERIGYHELPGLRHETKDVLKQLHNNIQMIEDLSGRLGFVMSEIRSLIRR